MIDQDINSIKLREYTKDAELRFCLDQYCIFLSSGFRIDTDEEDIATVQRIMWLTESLREYRDPYISLAVNEALAKALPYRTKVTKTVHSSGGSSHVIY